MTPERTHITPQMRDERVAVRTRPCMVRVGIGIRRDSLRQLADDRFGGLAAHILDQAWRRPKPLGIGRALSGYRHYRPSAAAVPPDHFVAGEMVGALGLGREPSVIGERATPAEGAARVDLHDCFVVRRGIRRQSGRAVRGVAPVARDRGPPERQRQHRTCKQQHEQYHKPHHHAGNFRSGGGRSQWSSRSREGRRCARVYSHAAFAFLGVPTALADDRPCRFALPSSRCRSRVE